VNRPGAPTLPPRCRRLAVYAPDAERRRLLRRHIARAQRGAGDETVWLFRFYGSESWLADVLDGGHVDGVIAAGVDRDRFTLPADLVWIDVDLDAPGGMLSLAADIAARIEQAEVTRKLAWLAEHDALTGLRRASTLGDDERPPGAWRLLHVELDAFADLADTLGPASADLALCAVARAVVRAAPVDAVCARVDDAAAFCVLVDERQAERTERDVASVLRQRFRLGADGAAEVQPSVRTRSARGDDRRAIADALAAVQPPEGAPLPAGATALAAQLAAAVDGDEFSIAFQPIVDLATGGISAAEALLRWHGQSVGDVAPDLFIPVAERSGVIVRIGEWVLEQACRHAVSWLDRAWQCVRLSVNVSPQQLRPPLVDAVRRLFDELPLASGQLELEIPGSAFGELDAPARSTLSRLRDLGVGIAIDDFVLARTPLSLLRRSRVDTCKLGRGQLARLARDDERALVEQHIRLAHQLGARTVAVGVETAEQLAWLRAHGCDEAQGFHLSPPLDAGALLMLMARQPAQLALPQAGS
jgi:EAL domain-containing protein (putative c-di-GMP-specific phosphodiesterase class I)/GGDEF domain-containing protein